MKVPQEFEKVERRESERPIRHERYHGRRALPLLSNQMKKIERITIVSSTSKR